MHETNDWIEYSETRVRVLHAIDTRPDDGFTAEALSGMLGLPIYEVRVALADLTADGQVLWVDDEYVSALQFD